MDSHGLLAGDTQYKLPTNLKDGGCHGGCHDGCHGKRRPRTFHQFGTLLTSTILVTVLLFVVLDLYLTIQILDQRREITRLKIDIDQIEKQYKLLCLTHTNTSTRSKGSGFNENLVKEETISKHNRSQIPAINSTRFETEVQHHRTIRSVRHQKKKGKRGNARNATSTKLRSTHFIPSHPQEGNLFVPTDKGYLEDDVYRYWKSTEWSDRITKIPDMMSFTGGRQIKKTGLYLIYAQITYFTKGNVGFTIAKDDSARTRLATCVETIPTPASAISIESCYTATVAKLEKGTTLLLLPLYHGTNFSMVASNTFWGLVKLR
jgi:hypothetical protein